MPSTTNESSKSGRRLAGLNEALWACFLDDYLSEEEEGELSKIVGRKEELSLLCFQEQTHRINEDPRTVKARGCLDDDDSFEYRNGGTPGVWNDAPTPEMPPIIWLAVPTETEEETIKYEPKTQQTDHKEDKNIFQQAHKRLMRGRSLPGSKHVRNLDVSRSISTRGRSITTESREDSPTRSRESRVGSRAGSKTASRATFKTNLSTRSGRHSRSMSTRGRSRTTESREDSPTRSRGSRVGSRASSKTASRATFKTNSSKRSGRQHRRSKSLNRVQAEQREPSISARSGLQAREKERRPTRKKSISSPQTPERLEKTFEPPNGFVDAQDRSLKSSSRRSLSRNLKVRRKQKLKFSHDDLV